MPPQPNILVFFTDDHGQWASSPYGNSEIISPTMQWLADTGARMDEAFTPTPVCSPARACFHTGRIASQHGIHDWLQEGPSETGSHPDHPGLRGQPVLAALLKEAGYHTGLVGKWHCGHEEEPHPAWDTWFTNARGTNARFGTQVFYEGTDTQTFQGHQETILTDRALRFLRERSSADPDSPFFLFVGYTNTHTPHTGESDPFVHQYRHCSFRDIPNEPYKGQNGFPRIAPFNPQEPQRREQLAQYYAAVHAVDQQMARIVAELENLGQLDHTLILYTSDHGHMNGHHGLHTKGNATIPLNFLDESIRVPLLLRWPNKIPPAQIHPFPVDHCDVFATLIDAAGLPSTSIAAQVTSPGKSFLPYLQHNEQPTHWRSHQICEYAYSRMIRTPNAKLIRRAPTKVTSFPDEFYDLSNDPRETNNVINQPQYAQTIQHFDQHLNQFFHQFADPDRAGTNMASIYPHNTNDPWNVLPTEGQHKQ